MLGVPGSAAASGTAQPGPALQVINLSLNWLCKDTLPLQVRNHMAIKFCHVNKADVVRILSGQIYSLTVEQQPRLGFVPPDTHMHPGLCFPSGQCPAGLCVRLQA